MTQKWTKKDNLNRPDSESYLKSTLPIDQKFIGVVTTKTEIWFFEKKIGSKKIGKNLRKNWKIDFFLIIFLKIFFKFLILNLMSNLIFFLILKFEIWNFEKKIKNHISVSVLTTPIIFWSIGRQDTCPSPRHQKFKFPRLLK
jgi:hypothetical protein